MKFIIVWYKTHKLIEDGIFARLLSWIYLFTQKKKTSFKMLSNFEEFRGFWINYYFNQEARGGETVRCGATSTWSEVCHPWIDLMLVTVSFPVLKRTSYNLQHTLIFLSLSLSLSLSHAYVLIDSLTHYYFLSCFGYGNKLHPSNKASDWETRTFEESETTS